MIYQTTTYNNSSNLSLYLGKVRMVFIFFIMMVMGVGSAWADTWDGATKTAPDMSTNNGSSETLAIQITKAAELAWLGDQIKAGNTATTKTYGDKYWKLTADIDLGGKDDFTGNDWASMIGNDTKAFCGYFDGGGHTVSNIQVASATSAKYYGLFPSIQGASTTNVSTVKDLNINGAYFKATDTKMGKTTRIGALAGYVKQASISGVAISNVKFVYTGGITDENDLGGAIGCAETTASIESVSVTTFDAAFTGATTNLYVAGLVGKINSLTSVKKCSTSDVTITYNTIANASRIAGLIGYTKGAANAPITINGCSVTNTKVDLKAGINNGSYIGALVAQTQDNTQIGDGTDANKNTVTSPDINIGSDIKAVSYIGGAIGDLAGATDETKTSVVKKLTVTSPTITVNNYSAGTSLTGGVFGRVSTFTAVDGVNLTGTSMSFTEDILVAQMIGTFAGNIQGSAAQEISVKNVAIDKSDLTFGSSDASNTTAIKAGVIGQVSSNVLLDTWKVTGNSSITVNGNLNSSVFTTKETADASRLGGFIGYTVTAASAPVTIKNIEIGGNSTISVTGTVDIKAAYLGGVLGYSELANAANNQMSMDKIEVKGTTSITVTGGINTGSYLGGFAGYILGRAATSCSIKIENITLASSSITVGGEVKAGSYIGGLAGQITTSCALKTWKITTSATITLGDITTATSYVGGAIGNINGASGYNSNLDDLSVGSPSVTINKVSYKDCYIGAVFGRINTYCDIIKTINVSNPTLTYKYTDNTINVPINLGTLAGGIFGVAAQKLDMTDVSITGNAQLTVGDATNATTNNICQIKAGLIGQSNTNVNLDNWTINSSAVTINGSLTTSGSQIGGFAGNLVPQDANDAQYWTNDITLTTSTINVTGNIAVASYLAGFVGYFQGRSKTGSSNNSTAITIGTSSITVGGNVTAGSYLGGFAGLVNQGCNLDNWKFTNATITVKGDVTAASFIGGALGSITAAASYPSAANNFTLGSATVTLGTNTSNQIIGSKIGLVGQASTNASLNTWTVTGNNSININSYFTSTASHVGGLIGFMESKASAPTTASNINLGENNSIVANGNITGTVYIGGAFGNLTGVADEPQIVSSFDLSKPTLTLNGDVAGTLNLGGLVGYMTIATLKESTVTGADIVLNGNNTNNMYVGGAIGWMNPTAAPYATVEKVTVKDSKIRTSGTHTYAKGSKPLVVGGLVGYLPQEATKFTDVHNCVVDNIDINLGGYIPEAANTSGNLNNQQQNAFVVGGVIGRINTPSLLPEHLYFTGNIYAPFAMVAPVVGVFFTKMDAANYAYDDYTGANATNVATQWKKSTTWYYTDYNLGLYPSVMTQKDRTKNYTEATTKIGDVDYLNIKPSTLLGYNFSSAGQIGKTVLQFNSSGVDVDFGLFPAWNTTTATYPNYYMYYMQGVNRGLYIDPSLAEVAKKIVLDGSDAQITLSQSSNRGFEQTFTAATTDAIDSYEWYYAGNKQTETSNTLSPSLSINEAMVAGQNVFVVGKNNGEPVAFASDVANKIVLRVKDDTKDASTFGTKSNPYVMGGTHGADELQLLSHLSTLDNNIKWEGDFISSTHYNRAYYELDDDIDMSGVAEFTPISLPKSNNTAGTISGYHQNFVFDGVFDGNLHTISGLNIGWYAGALNTNDQNMGWGLFAAIGNSTAQKKVGESVASNAVVQNLIIDGATLKHRTDNTSFYYNNANSGNANNCMVGVLAGMVSANTTIQNIEIRNSKITDEGSKDYSLAAKGLFVGGVIGSVQSAYNTTNIPTNTVIKNIVSGTDIELTHPKFQNRVVIAELGSFNVGGIIGRFAATNGNQEATQAVLPKYTLSTGAINAREATVGPAIGATRFSSNKDITLANISKIWEGNNNSTATQLLLEDALFYNFHITDGEMISQLITDVFPDKTCKNGARAFEVHNDGNEMIDGYKAQRYQGVNMGCQYIDATTYEGDPDGGKRMAVAILNSHNDVTMYWEWTPGAPTPHMVTERHPGAYIVADQETPDKYNVILTGTSGDKYYKWYVIGQEIPDENTSSITRPADITDVTIKVEVYDNSSDETPIAITQYYVIKGGVRFITSMTKDGDNYTVGISRDGTDLITNPDSRLEITYQWYKGNGVNTNTATKLSSTTWSIDITGDELGDVSNIFCHVVIRKKESGEIIFQGDVSRFVGDAIVVFLQLNDVKASNGTLYSKANAKANTGANDTYGVKQVDYDSAEYGKTPDKPVNSWAEAYALLSPYTEPTQADVTAHGGTWTSATNFDDEAYYLANKDDYPFDIYKREGNKRKVKPIDKCESNWDKNIIVLMGLSNDDYFNNSTDMPHNVDGVRANKPVTITGMFNGVNYYGFHSNPAGDLSFNADHKFENMGFGVSDKGIGATESVRYRIYAHRWNVYAGRGLLMGWAAALKWGPDVVPVNDDNKKMYKITNADISTGTPKGNYACDIAIMGGYLNDNTSDNPEMFEYINHGRDDIGQLIRIESGFWGPVCPGNRQTDSGNTINTYYTMGGPDHPAKTTITVDIYREDNDGNETYNSAMAPATVDVGCLLTGNHEGTMYADVTLNILSAKMGRIVNGIKGAQRRQIKKTDSFTTSGHYRHVINYGTKETPNWIEVAAPAPDSYFGRGIINFDPANSQNNSDANMNGRISVIELYCGGLGRGHNDGSKHPEVRTYFYGLSEINIKGGTFKETIYGCGAGGANGIGTAAHHTDDDGIPYWNTEFDPDKTRVWYAPYDYIKGNGHKYDFVKVKIQGTSSDDPNLEDGYVNLENTKNVINITGGVLGTMANPVSIYAGGNGEADASLINPHSSTSGDAKNTYNTPNHQAGNMYGSGNGYVSQVNISGNTKIYGNIYGGGKGSSRYYRFFLRAPETTVAYTGENQGYTHIMKAQGYEDDTFNKEGGIDWQKVIDTRRNADNYLNLGQVYGNTRINITENVEIFGDVFGAGEGVPDMTVEELFSSMDVQFGLSSNQFAQKDDILNYVGTALDEEGNPTGKRTAIINNESEWVAFPNLGKLFGNSMVVVNGENVHIHGNVYGGGKAGALDGNSTVVIKAGTIDGDVFGAGQGEANRPDKAKVTGNTNVIVDSNW